MKHIKSVYLQIQIWLGNKTLSFTDWGCTKMKGTLVPNKIKMADPPAPEELLKMIFCNCKKRCGSTCGCRNIGLKSRRNLRHNYSGDTCQNCPVEQEEKEVDEEEIDELES